MELDFTSHIYPADSILRADHLVVPPGYPDWKPLKLLDLEFANSITPVRHWTPAGGRLTLIATGLEYRPQSRTKNFRDIEAE
jgi:hypothetical protein